jgi:UDP-galactopyranose mutase
MMPRIVYDKFVRGYAQKQWGIPACSLRKELAGRFDVRLDDVPFLTRHKYQGIPSRGYAAFMKNLLNGIPQIMDCDYLKCRSSVRPRKLLIFTGPIDEFFGFELGRLKYRAQKRVHEFHPDQMMTQPVGQVNNPNPNCGCFIRTMEWKHMMCKEEAMAVTGTVLTREYPFTPDNPDQYEYPFPDESNSRLYSLYRERAAGLRDTVVCGRLGEYRYYDMDQAIARAILLSERMLAKGKSIIPVMGARTRAQLDESQAAE